MHYLKNGLLDFALRCREADAEHRRKAIELIGIHYDESKTHFHAIAVDDEYCVLFPEELQFSYYRGQSAYYDPCYPSLYRKEKAFKTELFIERLRIFEYFNLLEQHPAVIDLQGILFLGRKIKINLLGLAQHYGFKTELIDFTSDPLIAAFFAVTRYDSNLNRYEPVLKNFSGGVFYVYNENADMFSALVGANHNYEDFKLNAIGLQPFPRPGEQRAYSYRLSQGENLNKQKLISKYFFKHDKSSVVKIFEMFEGGKKLFPYDPIQEKVDIIMDSMTISEATLYKTYKEYGYGTVKKIKRELRRYGISLVSDPVVNFSADEIDNFKTVWLKGKNDFLAKIKYRMTY